MEQESNPPSSPSSHEAIAFNMKLAISPMVKGLLMGSMRAKSCSDAAACTPQPSSVEDHLLKLDPVSSSAALPLGFLLNSSKSHTSASTSLGKAAETTPRVMLGPVSLAASSSKPGKAESLHIPPRTIPPSALRSRSRDIPPSAKLLLRPPAIGVTMPELVELARNLVRPCCSCRTVDITLCTGNSASTTKTRQRSTKTSAM
mmetsp:Transcript_48082/g.112399  ORF Transcript_48082/g.112399 Transcript_48082/m.112399 type:complete len:202 (+) Transcript_48082:1042-1647(+)